MLSTTSTTLFDFHQFPRWFPFLGPESSLGLLIAFGYHVFFLSSNLWCFWKVQASCSQNGPHVFAWVEGGGAVWGKEVMPCPSQRMSVEIRGVYSVLCWGGSTLIAWIKWRRGGRFLHRKLTIFPFELENICGETTQWSHFSSYCHPRTVVVTQRALPSVILNHGVCPELIIRFSHSSLTHFFGGLLRGWNEERQLHQCPVHGEV